MNRILPIVFLILAICLCISPAQAVKRVALVIGNDNYDHLRSDQQLKKARNDASAVGEALKATGFTVISAFDVSRREFNLRVQQLVQRIEPGDTAAFFYAGHGVRIRGSNYLLPNDIPYISGGQTELLLAESINTERIIDQMRQRGAKVTLMILDACRNNPFQDKNGRTIGGSRGLAIMEPPEGTFILYSAGANQIALDRLSDADENPNSLFTRTLLPYLGMRGLEISTIAKQVRRKVRSVALRTRGHNQTPAVYNDLISDFYFFPSNRAQTSEQSALPSRKTNQYDSAYELTYWDTVKNSNVPSLFEAYLKRYPNGVFAELAKIKLAQLSKDQGTEPDRTQSADIKPKVFKPKIVISSTTANGETNEKKVVRLAPVRRKRNDKTADSKTNESLSVALAEKPRLQSAGQAASRWGGDKGGTVTRQIGKGGGLGDGQNDVDKGAFQFQNDQTGHNTNTALLQPSGTDNNTRPLSRTEAVPNNIVGSDTIRQIQAQLNRVDCSKIKVDGVWGRKSQAALNRARRRKNLRFNPDELSYSMLDELKGLRAARCLVSCSSNQVVRNGRCVAKSCPAGQKLSSKGKCYKSKTAKKKTEKVKQARAVTKPKRQVKRKKKRLCMVCNNWQGESIHMCGTRRFLEQQKVEEQCMTAVIR